MEPLPDDAGWFHFSPEPPVVLLIAGSARDLLRPDLVVLELSASQGSIWCNACETWDCLHSAKLG